MGESTVSTIAFACVVIVVAILLLGELNQDNGIGEFIHKYFQIILALFIAFLTIIVFIFEYQ